MRAEEVRMAVNLAMSSEKLSHVEVGAVEALGGLAVEKKPRMATLEQVAWFIRYQCLQFNGQLDMKELNELRPLLRQVQLVGNY